MPRAEPVQHHVDTGVATGTGEAMPVYLEQVGRHHRIGKILSQQRRIGPMYGRAASVQQTSTRQQVCPGSDTTDDLWKGVDDRPRVNCGRRKVP